MKIFHISLNKQILICKLILNCETNHLFHQTIKRNFLRFYNRSCNVKLGDSISRLRSIRVICT